MKIYFYIFFYLMILFSPLYIKAQVEHKQHDFDIVGDVRFLSDSKMYGVRASYPIFNFKSPNGKYSFPIQLYGGANYSTKAAWGYSFGIRIVQWRRNLDQTVYSVQDIHFRTGDKIVENFDKQEYISAFGVGYKMKPNVGIEYLFGGNYYSDFIHNFAIAKTIHFQTSKRLRTKLKIQDCPLEQE